MRSFFSFISGALMGALVGVTLALLFAPDSGDELQGEIRSRISAFQKEMQKVADTQQAEMRERLAQYRSPQE